MQKQLKIGYSFSGGGARAAAQAGMIQALRENDIEAGYVAGASGGSIVGALYAAGLSTSEMKSFAAEGNLFKLFKAGLPFRGLISLERLGELLDKYITTSNFEDLNVPLSIAVANLMTGQKEILNSGNLYQAVMASCAIPLLFQPVNIDGQLYVDGGVLDNMPVAPLQENCDFIIGMNIAPNTILPKKELNSMYAVGLRVLHMTASHSSELNFPYCNVVIEPKELANYNILKFDVSEELYEIGYRQAMAQMDDILEQITKKI